MQLAVLVDFSVVTLLYGILQCSREKNGIFLPPERYEELTRSLAAQSGSIKELEDLLGTHKVMRQ